MVVLKEKVIDGVSCGLCSSCHWLYEKGRYLKRKDGSVQPLMCSNIGEKGWHYWSKQGVAPTECESYCLQGTYEPTGFWSEVAKVVVRVADVIKGRA